MVTPNVCTSSHCCPETKSMKKALRETQTLRALAVVRFGHRPPAYPSVRPLQTGPITIHCAAKLSAKCNQVCHCFKLSLRGYNCTNQVTYFIQMHMHTHTHTHSQNSLFAVSSDVRCCTCSAVIRRLITCVSRSAWNIEPRINSLASLESFTSFTTCIAHSNEPHQTATQSNKPIM